MNRVLLVVGFVVCLAVGLVVGQSGGVKAASPAAPVTVVPQQRFQIAMRPDMRRDTFLLDTQTGRVWVITEHADAKGQGTGKTFWNPMYVIGRSLDGAVWDAVSRP